MTLPTEGKDLLTVEEVAAYLGVRPITVYRWCRQGRLPCLKLGVQWRIRHEALEDFLGRAEHSPTFTGQLRAFVRVPDLLLAVAESKVLLHRLDAAFFQVGEARGGLLVKFCGGEAGDAGALRGELARHGLAVAALERAGRLRFCADDDPGQGEDRAAALRRLLAERPAEGRSLWASFDWARRLAPGEALRDQEALRELVEAHQVVAKTAVLAEVVEAWPSAAQRRAQLAHRGMIWLAATGCALSRTVAVPPA